MQGGGSKRGRRKVMVNHMHERRFIRTQLVFQEARLYAHKAAVTECHCAFSIFQMRVSGRKIRFDCLFYYHEKDESTTNVHLLAHKLFARVLGSPKKRVVFLPDLRFQMTALTAMHTNERRSAGVPNNTADYIYTALPCSLCRVTTTVF